MSNPDQEELESEKFESSSKITHYAKKVGATILGGHIFWVFLIHRYSSWWRQNIIFAHFLRWPRLLNIDFNNSKTFDMLGVRNFYLESEKNVKIGVWQILPQSSISTVDISLELYDECLGDEKPIIIYAHGNSGDRGSCHRLDLYRILQKNDYHVITFDYRSYGDSSRVPPSEEGVVTDEIAVIQWVLQRKKSSKVFIWGHSLGTGISSRAIKILEEKGTFLDGLILEAPFNNLRDELKGHPFGLIMHHMIGFDYLFVKPFHDSGISFRSDEYLSQCRIQTLILHAENDWIVPVKLGRRLYNYLKKHRKDGGENVKYVQLGKIYGHKWICKCPSLMAIIKSFIEEKYDEIPSRVD